jgi:hypothetical protein
MRRTPQKDPAVTHTSTRSSMPRLTLVGDRLPQSAVEEAAVTRERFDSRASSSSTRLKIIAHKLRALDRNQPRYGQLNRAIREAADCRRDSQPCHDVIVRHTPQQWIRCHDGAGASGDWTFLSSNQDKPSPWVPQAEQGFFQLPKVIDVSKRSKSWSMAQSTKRRATRHLRSPFDDLAAWSGIRRR